MSFKIWNDISLRPSKYSVFLMIRVSLNQLSCTDINLKIVCIFKLNIFVVVDPNNVFFYSRTILYSTLIMYNLGNFDIFEM